MSGKTIGLNMNHGFAGAYARQPGMTIVTRANKEATAPIKFGAPVMQAAGGVKNITTAFTAADFVGFAVNQIQTSASFEHQNEAGEYAPNSAVAVIRNGNVNVYVNDGTPALYGKVYVRVTESGSKKVGDIECTEDKTGAGTEGDPYVYKNICLENCQFSGAKDANGIAEVSIFTSIGA